MLFTFEETTLQAEGSTRGGRWTQPGGLLSYVDWELTECRVGVVFALWCVLCGLQPYPRAGWAWASLPLVDFRKQGNLNSYIYIYL